MLRKGVSTILSAILVILISVVTLSIVLMIGLPAIEKGKEAAVLNEAMQNMKAISNAVMDVASEGVGSQRIVQMKVTDGEYKVNEKANSIDFNFISKSGTVQYGSFIKDGDVTLSAGSHAKASEYDMDNDGSTDLVLENDILRIGILKNGTKSSSSFINTTLLIRRLNFKETNENVTPSDSSIVLDDIEESSYGTGYSELVKMGDNMAKAETVVHMNTSYAFYDILYTLQSGADFVIVKIINAYYK